MKKLRVTVGIIIFLLGLSSLGGLAFLGFYLMQELGGPRQDNEGLYILGTFCVITLVAGVAGILGAAQLLRFGWISHLKPFWLVVLGLTGAVLLGLPGALILLPPGPMGDMDALLAWILVVCSAGMSIVALGYAFIRLRSSSL